MNHKNESFEPVKTKYPKLPKLGSVVRLGVFLLLSMAFPLSDLKGS
jgi:hypothetical protein